MFREKRGVVGWSYIYSKNWLKLRGETIFRGGEMPPLNP